MNTMQRPPRTAPPVAKWHQMFQKAVREGVQVRQLGSGMWVATSASDPRVAYAVSLSECECRGHEYHGYCKHRAMLAFLQGVLSIETPSAPPASSCRICDGRGFVADPDQRQAPEPCGFCAGERIAA